VGAGGMRGTAGVDPVDLALGLSVLLSLTHLTGVLAGFSGWAGPIVAWGMLVPGLAACLRFLVRAGQRAAIEAERSGVTSDFSAARLIRARDLVWLLGVVPAMLLLVAACSPPGWLWASEGRGYDTLSYHLQLPQEWLAAGRLWPTDHNVYSYLSSYIEGAFLHLAMLAGAHGPEAVSEGSAPWGLQASEGQGVFSAQFFSAVMAMLTAWAIAHLLRRALAVPREVAGLLAVAFLGIPWVLVTGSLAYNDLAVLFFFAAAATVAMDDHRAPTRRGILAAILIGAASSCKPTALLFAGIPVGVLLLAHAAPRQWAKMLIPGAITGLAMLAPWLVRNAIACGNPLFPFASGLLRRGHWSAEQVERYAHAHHFTGTLVDRLRLLVLVDPSDPAGPVHRGLLHPQWSIFFPLVLVASVVALAPARRTGTAFRRRAAVLMLAMLAIQLLEWLFTTHLQSRFLLPLIIPGIVVIGLALRRLPGPVRLPLAAGLAAVLTGHALWRFAREPSPTLPGPNAMLTAGTMYRTGEIDRAALDGLTGADRDRLIGELHPEAFVNLLLPREGQASDLLLVGSATPLYFTRPVRYVTTWDESPLAHAMREHPARTPQEAAGDAGRAWAAALKALGIRFLLVDFAELDRLTRSGFRDPALDPAGLHAFLQAHARPIRAWPELGIVLVEVP